ncbi:hypothetical protein GCM10008179_06300 [Hansschlegelia plantiphila]|uniref:DUSAM domain-containing protein n=2 Tax=Hansschlegelia plantiphila TaxID=374655 RepID=A0A9W6IXS4_9HYPH|nr:hypothetical protein GCM10008179_06300 [Hansschlegelia plantiphila]
MRRIIGAAKAMLRQMLRPKVMKRADHALQVANAKLAEIDRLAARETSGSGQLRDQLRRLQELIERGGR